MAFKSETTGWCKTYACIDSIFLIDIIFSFFTTLPPLEEEDELTDRKEIAKTYLKTWFSIELIAIIPIDFVFSCLAGKPSLCGPKAVEGQAPDANILLRFPKLLKLARVIRLVRMLKIFKLLKNKKHLQR